MSEIHKIRIKIGDAEFEAEGPTDLVTDQYKAFMNAVSTMAAKPEPPATTMNQSGESPDPLAAEIDSESLSKIFHQKGDVVSLSAMPSDKSDALILLLYGYLQLANVDKVTGVTMMKAAKQSGVGIDRVDRVIDSRSEYILTGGAKRGKRYSLNNKGIQYAQTIIQELLS